MGRVLGGADGDDGRCRAIGEPCTGPVRSPRWGDRGAPGRADRRSGSGCSRRGPVSGARAQRRCGGRALTWEPLADGEFVPVASPVWTVRIGAGRVRGRGARRPALGAPGVVRRGSADRAPPLAARLRYPARRAGRDHGAGSARVAEAVVAGAGITVLPAVCAWTSRRPGTRHPRTGAAAPGGAHRASPPGPRPGTRYSPLTPDSASPLSRTKESVTCPVAVRMRDGPGTRWLPWRQHGRFPIPAAQGMFRQPCRRRAVPCALFSYYSAPA